MDPISNADRLVAVLREKLRERARAARLGGQPKTGGGDRKAPPEPSGIHAMAAIEGADERQLRRAFIQNLLADQLGSALVNDPRFQQIVSRVTEAIEEDAATAELLNRLVAELRPW